MASRGGRARSSFGTVDPSRPAIVRLTACRIKPAFRNGALGKGSALAIPELTGRARERRATYDGSLSETHS